MHQFLEEYAKHAVLNFGQALQGLRYFFSHPDIDAQAPRGSLRHALLSAAKRGRLVANDLFLVAIPPHWHHTQDELQGMCAVPASRWFQYGYCAWRFDAEGQEKPDLAGAGRHWDPRCRA
jgi:hypothetical protein